MRWRDGVHLRATWTMAVSRSTTLRPNGRCVPSRLDERIISSADQDTGGQAAATIYSLIGTAKLNDIDPESYLQRVLQKIADLPITRINELLPWNFATPQIDLA